jgi:hypothetical protein
MAARGQARAGPHQASIQDSVMFFSAANLSNAKPVRVEDHEDWVLGVALAQYSMGAGIKKFQDKGEAGMTKELTQIHGMNVFHPIKRDFLIKEERAMVLALLMF